MPCNALQEAIELLRVWPESGPAAPWEAATKSLNIPQDGIYDGINGRQILTSGCPCRSAEALLHAGCVLFMGHSHIAIFTIGVSEGYTGLQCSK